MNRQAWLHFACRSREPSILLEQRFVTYIGRYPLLEMSPRVDGNETQVFTVISSRPSATSVYAGHNLIALSVAQRKAQNV